jgi:CO dehydrogenase maturation factor
MPVFHCPLGAPFYEGTDCIKCGLCLAKSKEDAIEASKKMRDYLRAQGSKRQRKYAIKKIAICGKGGVGKSTISSLIATTLVEYGYRTLVIDTDESNPGLHRMFGFDNQPKPLMTILERFSLDEPQPETEWLEKDKIAVEDIPSEFLLQQDDLGFMMVGKIDDPFQGCACSMAETTKDLLIKLALKDREIVLTDQEAGVESFGRGVERGVDTLLIVVEPTAESLALAEKINYMAEGIGIGRVRAILNKIPSEDIEEKIIDALVEKEIKYLGAVYVDPDVSEAAFLGKTIGDSKAREQIRVITRLMLDEAEMKYKIKST